VKEYVIQSAEFLICAFALAHLTLDAWQRNQVRVAAAVGLLALLFLANIVFVATGRGTAITLPLLAAVFSFQRFSWKGAFGSILIAIAFSTIIWSSSEYLRARVVALYQELYDYQAKGIVTSVGARLEFLRGSMKIISDAPMYGHGTGSTREQFRLLSSKTPHLPRFVTDNPHNQTLDVAVQLGLIGIVLLYAMWFAHMLLFWDRGTMAFVGFGVVTQKFVAGFFNSHLFEHSLGWLYVLGVGVLGGMVIGRTCKMSKLIADRYRPPG
jgi:O-antigen ligase